MSGSDADRSRLLVAGPPVDDQYLKQLQSLAAQLGMAEALRPGLMTDQALHDLIGSATLVVLPHDQSLNSGSVILALSLGVPVLTPRTPFTEEVQNSVGDDRLHLYEGTLNNSVLSDALSVATKSSGPTLLPKWADLAQTSISLWSEVLKLPADELNEPGLK